MNFDWKKPLMLLAIVAALVASGCGGDDEDGGDDGGSTVEQATGDPLSPEEYTSELGTVLMPLGTGLQEIGTATAAGPDDPEAVTEALAEASDTLQTGIDGMRGLVPPEGAEEGHEALIASLEDFKASVDDFSSVDTGDEQAVLDQVTALQEAAVTFQSDFQAAVGQLSEAGVELPTGAATGG